MCYKTTPHAVARVQVRCRPRPKKLCLCACVVLVYTVSLKVGIPIAALNTYSKGALLFHSLDLAIGEPMISKLANLALRLWGGHSLSEDDDQWVAVKSELLDEIDAMLSDVESELVKKLSPPDLKRAKQYVAEAFSLCGYLADFPHANYSPAQRTEIKNRLSAMTKEAELREKTVFNSLASQSNGLHPKYYRMAQSPKGGPLPEDSCGYTYVRRCDASTKYGCLSVHCSREVGNDWHTQVYSKALSQL